MPSGIKIKDVVVGFGLPADQKSRVVVHVNGHLKRGEVFLNTSQDQRPLQIELRRRECIAGLRYGIIGMRVGGVRKLIVSPHLGYGTDGLPGKVPPNAVLKFKVELLEVLESGVVKSEDYPPGRHMYFFWPGEIKRNRPRIQFGMEENGRCGIGMTIPHPGSTWRHAKVRSLEHQLTHADATALFAEVETMPHEHPKACLTEDLWADSSEKANSVTRDSATNTACITVGISEHGNFLHYYSMRENDPVLLESKLYRLIKKLIANP